MTPQRWQQVESLYEAASALPMEERAALLAETAERDAELAEEVGSLLGQGVATDGPLEAFARDAALWNPLLRLPRSIADFRILDIIGEGGMGIVYRAEQAAPRRVVALKVLSALRGAALEHRFKRESAILASLHHPGIAQVYSAGVADGLPFFAMELIEGVPLRTASKDMSTRAIAELMVQICHAVEHAHSRGIVHRDLKPENILVSHAGDPKILDFGVAHLVKGGGSGPLATMTLVATTAGELVGTLAYMSPEQVSGDTRPIDARSDVYSLGLILYELIAKRPCYLISGNISQAVRTIVEAEARPVAGIPTDLELIMQKALAKDRDRRYLSAGALGSDLERYLRGEPVTARPATVVYRVRKFLARNRTLAVASMLVFVSLVVAIIAISLQYQRALDAERRVTAINNFLLNDLLLQASPREQSPPNGKTSPELTIRAALDRAAADVGSTFRQEPGQEAAVRDTIGRAYVDLGVLSDGIRQLERSVALHTLAYGPRNPQTAQAMTHLADAYCKSDRFDAALELLGRAYQIQHDTLGDDHLDTIAILNEMAIAYDGKGDAFKALPMLEKAVAGYRRKLGDEDVNTLSAENNLAGSLTNLGRFAEAGALYRSVLATKRKTLGLLHPRTLFTLNSLAVVERNLGHYQKARELFTEAYQARRQSLGAEHVETLASARSLALLSLAEGKAEEAAMQFEQTCAISRRTSPKAGATFLCRSNWAEALYKSGRKQEAEEEFSQALASARANLTPNHRTLYRIEAAYGEMLVEESNWQQAEPVLQDAARIQNHENFHDWRRYYVDALLGRTLAMVNRPTEAGPLLAQSAAKLTELQATVPYEHRSIVAAVINWKQSKK